MLSVLVTAISRLIGGSFALFNVLTLLVVTPVVAFYLLRDWPRLVARIDGWLPRRYAGALRAQAREVDRILSAWLRGQALCCIVLALFYASGAVAGGVGSWPDRRAVGGLLSFIPYVGTITGAVTSIGLACAQFSDLDRSADRGGRVRRRADSLKDMSSIRASWATGWNCTRCG